MLLRQALHHHGWPVSEGPAAPEDPMDMGVRQAVDLDPDDQIAAAKGDREKMEWALTTILERGEKDFFEGAC